jgi:hypothetical protein
LLTQQFLSRQKFPQPHFFPNNSKRIFFFFFSSKNVLQKKKKKETKRMNTVQRSSTVAERATESETLSTEAEEIGTNVTTTARESERGRGRERKEKGSKVTLTWLQPKQREEKKKKKKKRTNLDRSIWISFVREKATRSRSCCAANAVAMPENGGKTRQNQNDTTFRQPTAKKHFKTKTKLFSANEWRTPFFAKERRENTSKSRWNIFRQRTAKKHLQAKTKLLSANETKQTCAAATESARPNAFSEETICFCLTSKKKKKFKKKKLFKTKQNKTTITLTLPHSSLHAGRPTKRRETPANRADDILQTEEQNPKSLPFEKYFVKNI